MFQLKFGWINLPTSTINILFAERQNFDCNFCLYCSILVGLQTDISRPIYGLYGISTYTYMIVLFFLYLINFFRTATGRFYPCMYCLPVSANIPSSRCCATVWTRTVCSEGLGDLSPLADGPDGWFVVVVVEHRRCAPPVAHWRPAVPFSKTIFSSKSRSGNLHNTFMANCRSEEKINILPPQARRVKVGKGLNRAETVVQIHG